MIKNFGNLVVISILSVLIFILYSSQYPGGVAGMAPLVLIISMPIAGLITLIITYCLKKNLETKLLLNSIIFFIICSTILIFYFYVIPFNSKEESPYYELNNWYYYSIIISIISTNLIPKIVLDK